MNDGRDGKQKENQRMDKLKAKLMDKNSWLLAGIIGLLLLVIALPTGGQGNGGDSGDTGSLSQSIQAGSQAADKTPSGGEAAAVNGWPQTQALEQQLEETLSLIDGAGRVRVMLTLKDTGEKVIEKDTARRFSGSGDDAGTEDITESTVFDKDGSVESPYISNELTPQVEGVLVVAQGGGNSLVKQNILQAVMALFPLEAHKITIVKMSMQEVSEQ